MWFKLWIKNLFFFFKNYKNYNFRYYLFMEFKIFWLFNMNIRIFGILIFLFLKKNILKNYNFKNFYKIYLKKLKL